MTFKDYKYWRGTIEALQEAIYTLKPVAIKRVFAKRTEKCFVSVNLEQKFWGYGIKESTVSTAPDLVAFETEWKTGAKFVLLAALCPTPVFDLKDDFSRGRTPRITTRRITTRRFLNFTGASRRKGTSRVTDICTCKKFDPPMRVTCD